MNIKVAAFTVSEKYINITHGFCLFVFHAFTLAGSKVKLFELEATRRLGEELYKAFLNLRPPGVLEKNYISFGCYRYYIVSSSIRGAFISFWH